MTAENELAYFGSLIDRLIHGGSLTREEARRAWRGIIANEQPEIQQGAFLAALAAKGETSDEITGSYEAIYELDTNRVDLRHLTPLAENCGTGMDRLKTFNISTAAAVIAAAGGIYMARHGARAITSRVGTVDLLEEIGIDVECEPAIVRNSIEQAGIGIFNGMSPRIHPAALGRILGRIRFGSTLNIAGSLANPAQPDHALRGVYSEKIVHRVAKTMRDIGYKRAMVVFGWNEDHSNGIDELSTMGTTTISELKADGTIEDYELIPGKLGIKEARFNDLQAATDLREEARTFLRILTGSERGPRRDIVCLNAAPLFYVTGQVDDLGAGLEKSYSLLDSGAAVNTLREWVVAQNQIGSGGPARLDALLQEAV